MNDSTVFSKGIIKNSDHNVLESVNSAQLPVVRPRPKGTLVIKL